MMEVEWFEIPQRIGAPLWSALRGDLSTRDGRVMQVHESASDPDGRWGRPSMMTVVGTDAGPLLRLLTTWDKGESNERLNEATRYWLPNVTSLLRKIEELEDGDV